MTQEEITALAREYAEEMIKGKPSEELPNCLKNSMLAMNTEHVAEIFQWLTRRFYIVEKSHVEEEYKSNKHYFEHTDSSNPTQKQYFWGRMCAIKSLFSRNRKGGGRMSHKSLFSLFAASTLMAAQSNNFYRYGERKRYSMDGNHGFSNKIPKAVDSRQLREFSIKGNKIMAYSRKDAITRLKYLKKL